MGWIMYSRWRRVGKGYTNESFCLNQEVGLPFRIIVLPEVSGKSLVSACSA